ncbi:DUF2441 domain-containing protein [Butyrivibrio sp. AE3006]|uniref:DUF2441 domain-containing protein n=1 Tax=Butyrivibrio sp. AE3006 TaxID=1280673 RepID=UPI00040EA571|nr:DUF2441 domain-containing protein [Butyrivibrio sp. AE3006]
MEKYYYHVISDIPKTVGEHIILDDKHPNGVHKRVYEELETVNDIYNNLEKYKDTELTHKVDVALRELALEKVRKEKYSEYPSRMASLYVSKSYEEAERWGVPKDAYLECMTAYLNKETENGWYLCMLGDQIVGG